MNNIISSVDDFTTIILPRRSSAYQCTYAQVSICVLFVRMHYIHVMNDFVRHQKAKTLRTVLHRSCFRYRCNTFVSGYIVVHVGLGSRPNRTVVKRRRVRNQVQTIASNCVRRPISLDGQVKHTTADEFVDGRNRMCVCRTLKSLARDAPIRTRVRIRIYSLQPLV